MYLGQLGAPRKCDRGAAPSPGIGDAYSSEELVRTSLLRYNGGATETAKQARLFGDPENRDVVKQISGDGLVDH